MDVLPIAALSDNYIWALIGRDKNVWVVDPGEAEVVFDYLDNEGLILQGILVTHHHWDHTGGVSALKQQFDVPVYGPIDSAFALLTHQLKDGDTLTLDSAWPIFNVIAIPGHTLDHVAYYAKGSLFCGDTLFAAGCGKVFEGSMSQMHASLQRLTQLPSETKIYCGHEYTLTNLKFAEGVEPDNAQIKKRIVQVEALRAAGLPSLPSTLEEEYQTNPFLRCEQSAVRARVEQKVGRELFSSVAVFEGLRRWKG